MKKIVLALSLLFIHTTAKADIFLATHLILNALAVKYVPDYESTSFHGPTTSIDYGYRYEQGEAYKLGKNTVGSKKPSYGIRLGYQFLSTETHKLAFVYARKYAKFIGKSKNEAEVTIDSFGMRLNFGILAIKFGWSSHGFEDTANKYDAGVYTGVGFDINYGKFSIYMDLTSHYLEERDQHMAGGDIGLRYSWGDSTI